MVIGVIQGLSLSRCATEGSRRFLALMIAASADSELQAGHLIRKNMEGKVDDDGLRKEINARSEVMKAVRAVQRDGEKSKTLVEMMRPKQLPDGTWDDSGLDLAGVLSIARRGDASLRVRSMMQGNEAGAPATFVVKALESMKNTIEEIVNVSGVYDAIEKASIKVMFSSDDGMDVSLCTIAKVQPGYTAMSWRRRFRTQVRQLGELMHLLIMKFMLAAGGKINKTKTMGVFSSIFKYCSTYMVAEVGTNNFELEGEEDEEGIFEEKSTKMRRISILGRLFPSAGQDLAADAFSSTVELSNRIQTLIQAGMAPDMAQTRSYTIARLSALRGTGYLTGPKRPKDWNRWIYSEERPIHPLFGAPMAAPVIGVSHPLIAKMMMMKAREIDRERILRDGVGKSVEESCEEKTSQQLKAVYSFLASSVTRRLNASDFKGEPTQLISTVKPMGRSRENLEMWLERVGVTPHSLSLMKEEMKYNMKDLMARHSKDYPMLERRALSSAGEGPRVERGSFNRVTSLVPMHYCPVFRLKISKAIKAFMGLEGGHSKGKTAAVNIWALYKIVMLEKGMNEGMELKSDPKSVAYERAYKFKWNNRKLRYSGQGERPSFSLEQVRASTTAESAEDMISDLVSAEIVTIDGEDVLKNKHMTNETSSRRMKEWLEGIQERGQKAGEKSPVVTLCYNLLYNVEWEDVKNGLAERMMVKNLKRMDMNVYTLSSMFKLLRLSTAKCFLWPEGGRKPEDLADLYYSCWSRKWKPEKGNEIHSLAATIQHIAGGPVGRVRKAFCFSLDQSREVITEVSLFKEGTKAEYFTPEFGRMLDMAGLSIDVKDQPNFSHSTRSFVRAHAGGAFDTALECEALNHLTNITGNLKLTNGELIAAVAISNKYRKLGKKSTYFRHAKEICRLISARMGPVAMSEEMEEVRNSIKEMSMRGLSEAMGEIRTCTLHKVVKMPGPQTNFLERENVHEGTVNLQAEFAAKDVYNGKSELVIFFSSKENRNCLWYINVSGGDRPLSVRLNKLVERRVNRWNNGQSVISSIKQLRGDKRCNAEVKLIKISEWRGVVGIQVDVDLYQGAELVFRLGVEIVRDLTPSRVVGRPYQLDSPMRTEGVSLTEICDGQNELNEKTAEFMRDRSKMRVFSGDDEHLTKREKKINKAIKGYDIQLRATHLRELLKLNGRVKGKLGRLEGEVWRTVKSFDEDWMMHVWLTKAKHGGVFDFHPLMEILDRKAKILMCWRKLGFPEEFANVERDNSAGRSLLRQSMAMNNNFSEFRKCLTSELWSLMTLFHSYMKRNEEAQGGDSVSDVRFRLNVDRGSMIGVLRGIMKEREAPDDINVRQATEGKKITSRTLILALRSGKMVVSARKIKEVARNVPIKPTIDKVLLSQIDKILSSSAPFSSKMMSPDGLNSVLTRANVAMRHMKIDSIKSSVNMGGNLGSLSSGFMPTADDFEEDDTSSVHTFSSELDRRKRLARLIIERNMREEESSEDDENFEDETEEEREERRENECARKQGKDRTKGKGIEKGDTKKRKESKGKEEQGEAMRKKKGKRKTKKKLKKKDKKITKIELTGQRAFTKMSNEDLMGVREEW
jgi:hypothetical protein